MKLEYLFIKPENNYYTTEDAFKKFLSSNSRIGFETADTLKLDDSKLKYSLKLTNVEKSKELIFHFCVESSGNEEEQITLLEKFDLLIKEINTTCGQQFAINRIWNDVSIYYGKKLYPEILNIENLLRKIIYLFMLKTVGSKWLDTNTPEKFHSNITAVIEKNNKNIQDITEEWLTYADFITLVYFFTAPYSLKSDLSKLFDELKKYQAEESETKASSASKKKAKHAATTPLTATIIEQLSNEYAPKNNWERYFSDKLKVKSSNKFSSDWSSLYDIRNKVAHGKPLDKVTYEKATNLINTYSSSFTECISIIDTLDITIEQAEAVEAIAQQVIPQETSVSYTEENQLTPMPPLYSTDIVGSEIRINESSLSTDAFKLSDSESITSTLLDPHALQRITPNVQISSLVDGISQTLKTTNPLLEYPGLLKTTSQLARTIQPLSQITVPASLGLTLSPSKISAALDTPLFISSKLPTTNITATELLASKIKSPLTPLIEPKITSKDSKK